jgi:mannose-6-phosphate isomerase
MEIVKLYPECKDNIWGGTLLRDKYGKQTDKEIVAESWELSFHKDGPTRLADGKTLQETATAEELGKNCEGFPFFPVLAKLIDAKQDLSVQVHPSDAYALKNENSFGKTEMWYIVEADEGAGIYLGFKKDVTKEEYEQAIKDHTLTDLLNFFEVKAGDCYFIPSGTIHAIGAGITICEIQETSDTTYRLYDFGRLDKDGNPRELHIEKGTMASNLNALSEFYEVPEKLADGGEKLVECPFFTTYRRFGGNSFTVGEDSFSALTVVSGEGTLSSGGESLSVRKGDTVFIPAGSGEVTVGGNIVAIDSRI